MKEYISNSPAQTKNFAKKIARQFKTGKVLGLIGELGSGKTQFFKGLAEYFKVKKPVTSPTFVLLKSYKIKNKNFKQLVHIDCYRLNKQEEILDIGLSEYLQQAENNLIVIEWAEKIKDILPKKNVIWIKFKFGKGKNQRLINLK